MLPEGKKLQTNPRKEYIREAIREVSMSGMELKEYTFNITEEEIENSIKSIEGDIGWNITGLILKVRGFFVSDYKRIRKKELIGKFVKKPEVSLGDTSR